MVSTSCNHPCRLWCSPRFPSQHQHGAVSRPTPLQYRVFTLFHYILDHFSKGEDGPIEKCPSDIGQIMITTGSAPYTGRYQISSVAIDRQNHVAFSSLRYWLAQARLASEGEPAGSIFSFTCIHFSHECQYSRPFVAKKTHFPLTY